MKNICQSRYNTIVIDDADIYVYNALSQGLAQIEPDELDCLKHPKAEKEYAGVDSKKLEILTNLLKGGFLVDEDLDELDILRMQMNAARFNSECLSLTIAPTSNCNFRCIYCYEKDVLHSKSMDAETIRKISDFVCSAAKNLKSLAVTWYGGEPMLEMETIQTLSKEFLEICEEFHLDYQASMITNGWFLNEENCRILQKCKITYLQVTLDGPRKIHDTRRKLSDGTGTYDTILSNLKNQYTDLPYISLRVNLDRSSEDALKQVEEQVSHFDSEHKIRVYPGHVQSIQGCCDASTCFTNEEFAEIQYKHDHASPQPMQVLYPRRVFNCCGADSLNSLIIDAYGDFYKCWDDIGIPEKRIGSLDTGIEVNHTYLRYMNLDATRDPECAECEVLPLCMGGCPHHYFENKNCSGYKQTLQRRIQDFIQVYKKEKLQKG